MTAQILPAKSCGLTQKPCAWDFIKVSLNPCTIQTTKPHSAATLTGLLTTNQPESIEVAIQNDITHKKILPFAVCNAYVQCTAWRTSIAVYYHFPAISRMRHAACNGAVFFDGGAGVASTNTTTNDIPRRLSMVGGFAYLSGYAYLDWYGFTSIFPHCETPNRPLMVLLVGNRSRLLAGLLASIPTPAINATSTAVKKHLRIFPLVSGYGILTSSGLCCLSQSLSAAFMRVCQPLPVALNASTTSGEYRIFTATFGQSVTGRPLRRKLFNWLYGKSLIFSSSSNIVSGSDFAALRIFASSSSEGSIVPGLNLSFDMAFNLPSVRLSQADNSALITATVSKYNAVNTVMQIAKCYKSVFPVIVPRIRADDRRIPFEELSLSQRNAVFMLVDGVLVCIKSDFHRFIVATINDFAKRSYWITFPLHPLFVQIFCFDQNSAYFTTTAASEREACLQLPAVRLVFIARIRMEVQHYA